MKKIFPLLIFLLMIISCTEKNIITEFEIDLPLDSLLANLKDRDTTIINITIINNDTTIIINNNTTTIINPKPDTIKINNSPLVYTLNQPICGEKNGSIFIKGLPVGWTINPLNINGNESEKIISLSPGSYNLYVTNKSGYLSPTFTVVINNPPITPNSPKIGEIKQPTKCDPLGSVLLTDLPDGNWIITIYPSKNSYTGNGKNVWIKGLDPKYSYENGGKCYSTGYRFTVTNSFGCTSEPSDEVTIKSYN